MELAPIKFLQWILGIAFTIGLADGFSHLTYQMGRAALHAQKQDQVSWGKYSRILWKDEATLNLKQKINRMQP